MRSFRTTYALGFLLVLPTLLNCEVTARSQTKTADQLKNPRETYFPKVTLLTQEGKDVSFYDDLIKGKIVVINFMYTRCDGQLCGDGTKNLVKLQNALGDRL